MQAYIRTVLDYDQRIQNELEINLEEICSQLKITKDEVRHAMQKHINTNVKNIVKEEMVQIKKEVGEQKFEKGNYERAAKMFEEMSIANQFEDFLTVPAYNEIIRSEAR